MSEKIRVSTTADPYRAPSVPLSLRTLCTSLLPRTMNCVNQPACCLLILWRAAMSSVLLARLWTSLSPLDFAYSSQIAASLTFSSVCIRNMTWSAGLVSGGTGRWIEER
eukprot:748052-Hanusia_phi.AAC.2